MFHPRLIQKNHSTSMASGLIDLAELVRMKLLSNRRKDQVHMLDMIGVGLIDATWPARFEPPSNERLQTLLDDPDG